MKEPKITCPIIDNAITYVEAVKEDILELLSFYEDVAIDDVQNLVEDMKNCISKHYDKKYVWGDPEVLEPLEEIRKANSELREYGNYWEKRAEELEKEVEDLESRLQSVEDDRDSYEDQVEELQQEVKELIAYNNKLQSELRGLEQ